MRCLLTILAATAMAAEPAIQATPTPLTVTVGSEGGLWFSDRGRHLMELVPVLAGAATAAASADGAGGWRLGDGSLTVATRADGSLAVRWRLAALAAVRLAVPAQAAAPTGGWTLAGRSGGLPVLPGGVLHQAEAATVALHANAGPAVALTLARAGAVSVVDTRNDRQAALAGLAALVPAVDGTLELVVSSPAGCALAEAEAPPQPGPGWLPLPLEQEVVEGSACDLTGLGLLDGPAGRHGRVVAEGGHFAFAGLPGVRQRFYGVNLVAATQYLDQAGSERLVGMIARHGYNAVRIHHWDRLLVEGSADSATPDPARLAALDRLIALLQARGIYLTIDLFCNRAVPAGELGLAVDSAPTFQDFKALLPVSEAAVANWRRFVLAVLQHVNPHTGRRWADEPAWVGMTLVNEGASENFHARIVKAAFLREPWTAAWNRWLAARHRDRAALALAWGADPGGDPAAGSVPLPAELKPSPATAELLRFYAVQEEALFARLRAVVRDEARCLAPLTNLNGWSKRVTSQIPRLAHDYVDDHWYIDHPSFSDPAGKWQPPFTLGQFEPTLVGGGGMAHSAWLRLDGKPYTATEFNFCSPGRFRAAGGLLTGALAALQDWGGVWRYAWAHTEAQAFTGQRAAYFDLATDPLTRASEAVGIALFLRGDLEPASERITVALPRAQLEQPPAEVPGCSPSWATLAWQARVATTVADGGATLATRLGQPGDPWRCPPAEGPALVAAAGVRLPAGTVVLDGPAGALLVDTPASGGLHALPGVSARLPRLGLEVDRITAAAAITVIALDRLPAARSARLLVGHLTEQQNAGTRWATPRGTPVLDHGKLPHLVRAGSARIRLALTGASGARVWALSPGGRRLAEIPATVADGRLEFTADPASGLPAGAPALHYEVVPVR